MDDLSKIARAVTRAVHERLGSATPEVVETVVREVLAATAGKPAASPGTPTPTADQPSLTRNDDGTMTTGLGSILPWPDDCLPLPTCANCVEQERRRMHNRAVITATGANRSGVIATLTACIAEVGGDIQDVSQTIISEFFTLIFVVDLGDMSVSFAELKKRVQDAATELGVHVVAMHEDVMRALQRV